MSEKNFSTNILDEQTVQELYGDVVEEPIQLIAWRDIEDDGCTIGFYCPPGTNCRGIANAYKCRSCVETTKCD